LIEYRSHALAAVARDRNYNSLALGYYAFANALRDHVARLAAIGDAGD